MVTSTVRPPRATPAPVPTPDRGSTSLKISTAPRPMAPMPNRMAEAVATRLAAALSAAERARTRTASRRRLAHSYSTAKTISARRITSRPGPGATSSTTPTARITVPTTVMAIRRSNRTRFMHQGCQVRVSREPTVWGLLRSAGGGRPGAEPPPGHPGRRPHFRPRTARAAALVAARLRSSENGPPGYGTTHTCSICGVYLSCQVAGLLRR
jgi:hypothetical protein